MTYKGCEGCDSMKPFSNMNCETKYCCTRYGNEDIETMYMCPAELKIEEITKTIRDNNKQTEGKLQWSLLDIEAIEELIKVRMWATSTKYKDPNGWKKVPEIEFIDAIARHRADLLKGKIYDDESGLLITAHIQCNAMFLSSGKLEKGV